MNKWLKWYYENSFLRFFIGIIYFINEILLCLYLMFIPVQIAYFWLLNNDQNQKIQDSIDITVLVLFTVHILLYFDQKMQNIFKNPYTKPQKQIITVQFVYDIFTLFLSIYLQTIISNTVAQRIIYALFFFKMYKLIKFDLTCTYNIVGTSFYPFYKLIRTLLILFMVISYIGSIFYGIAYYLYISDSPHQNLIWIVSTPAIENCVDQPFIIQLQYAIYWAIGTASTAAYGDISAADPLDVLWNILALAFEGFIFGFYLDSMHSIPMDSKKKQADLLQKFDSFQQHSSNRKLDKKLYLQILCSLEYNQIQKRSFDSLSKVMPKKYMQQIKYHMYSKFIGNQAFFRGVDLQLAIAEEVCETVCELDEDVYKYETINSNDLLFVKQGSIEYHLSNQLSEITTETVNVDEYFGIYSFLTGLNVFQEAKCLNYSVIYSLSRENYKKHLNMKQKISFNIKMLKAFHLIGQMLVCDPVINYYQCLELNSSFLILRSPDMSSINKKIQFVNQKNKQMKENRRKYGRGFLKSKKVLETRKTRDFSTQTQVYFIEIQDKVLVQYGEDF